MEGKIVLSSMNFEEAVSNSLELAKKIEKRGDVPDCLIGISMGGILPAQIISDYLNSPLILIRVSRPLTSAKKYFGLNKLPKSFKYLLRKMEMFLGLYRIMGRRTVSEIPGKLSPGKYVIVDDSLDTGKTVCAVLKHLEARGICRENILIAVLTQIFDDAFPQADCFIHKNINFCFPWSRDSAEYNKFVKFCQNRPSLAKFV